MISTATDYLAIHAARVAQFPAAPVLPRTQFYFDDGTPEYNYFKTHARVGEPTKYVLRRRMTNTTTGARSFMVELTDKQITQMRAALAIPTEQTA